MTLIATLVTGSQALQEFQLLLHTLEQWEPTAQVFVLTDTPTCDLIAAVKTRIRLETRVGLDDYVGLTYKDMEAMDGRKYATRFHDFAIEKATALEWVFEARDAAVKEGVWFLETSICLLAPLPACSGAMALSPHSIRAVDEAKFGRYNAGMLWVRDKSLLNVWRKAMYSSRFFEQAALEAMASVAADLMELPIQNNYGVWNYLQSADPPPIMAACLGYNRTLVGCGLTYDGQVLRSLQTHWNDANDFNEWMRGRLEFVARGHPPAKTLVQHIGRLYGHKDKDKVKTKKD